MPIVHDRFAGQHRTAFIAPLNNQIESARCFDWALQSEKRREYFYANYWLERAIWWEQEAP